MKKIFLFFALVSFITINSQEKLPIKRSQNGFAAIDYLSVKMPLDEDGNPEENMGLTGIHYNLLFSDSFYAGLGFYGSIHGKRGGLFTLGINAGVKKNLTDFLFLDTGFHFGGGGGAGAPDGGGAFILPHLNLGYQFKNFSASAGYSYINFFDKGNINSSQINFRIQVPISVDNTSFNNKEKSYNFNRLKESSWNQNSKRLSLTLHLNNLSPYGKSKFTDGVTLKDKTIRLAGFNLNSYLNDNWFVFFKADGAYHGIRGGYMDIIIGGGYHLAFNKSRTNILTKFGIGAGGGGGVDSAGGFLIYPDISIEQHITNNVYLSVNKGFLMSPDSHFLSSTLGVGLKYYIDKDGIELLELIRKSTNKLKSLINSLLKYSKSSKIVCKEKSIINLITLKTELEILLIKDKTTEINLKTKLQTIKVNPKRSTGPVP